MDLELYVDTIINSSNLDWTVIQHLQLTVPSHSPPLFLSSPAA